MSESLLVSDTCLSQFNAKFPHQTFNESWEECAFDSKVPTLTSNLPAGFERVNIRRVYLASPLRSSLTVPDPDWYASVLRDSNVHSYYRTAPFSDRMVSRIFDTPRRSTRAFWYEIAERSIKQLRLADIAELIKGISADLNARNFSEIDSWIGSVVVSNISVDAMVAIARTTWAAKAHLHNWASFVNKARIAMEQRGEPGPHLRGL